MTRNLYFDLLPYYAILRSIPSKIFGVIGMLGSLLILLAMPVLDTSRVRGNQFRPLSRFAFWALVTIFFVLMHIGSQHAESPFIEIGQVATALYFCWFLIIVPVVGVVENTLMDIATDNSSISAIKKNTFNERRNYSTSNREKKYEVPNLIFREKQTNKFSYDIKLFKYIYTVNKYQVKTMMLYASMVGSLFMMKRLHPHIIKIQYPRRIFSLSGSRVLRLGITITILFATGK